MQCARRLEAVGMGGNPAHGMERHRPADEALVPLAMHVGPWLVEDNRLVEGDAGDLGSKTADHLGGDAGLRGDGFRARISDRDIFRQAVETPARRSGRRQAGSAPKAPAARPGCPRGTGALGDRLEDQRLALAIAGNSPCSAVPGASITSHGALV